MAVPSSGTLSMQDIACEKVFDNYNHPTDGLGLSQRAGIGAISLADVSTSGNSNGSGTSFDATNGCNAASDRPDGATSHSMSEFYSYDHDKSCSSLSLTGVSDGMGGNPPRTLYYPASIGAASNLSQGDILYSNSGLTTPEGASYNSQIGTSSTTTACSGGNCWFFDTNSSGVLQHNVLCQTC